MTIEEAKTIFINRGFVKVDGGSIYDPNKWRESVKVISDWLEQEPCEDCISRQAVLDGKVIHQSCDGLEIINSHAVPVEYIEQLPPVTPKPKTGRWVNKSRRSGCGILFVESQCTCCGKKTPFNCDEFIYSYCPNCGAKMVEPQESEG